MTFPGIFPIAFFKAAAAAGRQTQYAESTGQNTTSSATYQDKVTLTFTPGANTDQFVFACALLNHGATSTSIKARFINGATTYNEVLVEPKDTTDYWSFAGMTRDSFGASPASQTYEIEFGSSGGVTTAAIKEARILAVQANAADQYAESLTDSTTTSGTPQDKTTLTFTPASQGDFYFFWCADMNVNSATGNFGAVLDIDGTDYDANAIYTNDSTSYRTVCGLVPNINLTAASHTIKIQFHSDGSNTATIRNAKIIAFREDVFSAAQVAHQTTRQTRTASTYADVTGATLTFTPAASEHILFGHSIMDHSLNTSSGFNQFLEDATVLSEMLEEPNTGTLHKSPFFMFYRKTLAAASTTWAIQHKAESTGTVGSDELAIAIFQTGA